MKRRKSATLTKTKGKNMNDNTPDAAGNAASDTPETDAVEFLAQIGMMPPYNTVASNFARQLERELFAARAETFAARIRTNEAIRDCDNAIKERDEARECLREVLQNSEFSEWVGVTIWHRWRKAAGLDAGEAK